MTSTLSRQLTLLGHESRSVCIEHARTCLHPTSDINRAYKGYVALVAHQNLFRMKYGPTPLQVASRRQFHRVVSTLLLDLRDLPVLLSVAGTDNA
jgi:hypothetical protein